MESNEKRQVEEAFADLTKAVERILSLAGEESDSLLGDYVVVASSQSFDDEGRLRASTILIPRDAYVPDYRLKGLIQEASDELRGLGSVVLVNSDLDDEDDEE